MTNTEYAGNYIYEDNGSGAVLQFFSTPEGYVEPNGSGGYDYVYQYRDHLGNIRLSYQDISGNYGRILDSDFENSFDGWEENGSVNYSLDNGRLKANVNSSYEGVRHPLTGVTTTAGEKLQVQVDFDKGNTQSNVRLYLPEYNPSGSLVRYNVLTSNLQTGRSEHTLTMVDTGNRIGYIRIDKDNTNTGTETYFYIDHVTLSRGELEITEENNYYPFGLKHKGYNNVVNGRDHKFEYNDVEMETSLGYNMMEMGMRHYNPAIGRFSTIDPVTHHRYSTYQGHDNNPIFWSDPTGADSEQDNSQQTFFHSNYLNQIGGHWSDSTNSGEDEENETETNNETQAPPYYYNWETNEVKWFASREDAASFWGNNNFFTVGFDSRDFVEYFGTIISDTEENIKETVVNAVPDGLSISGQVNGKLLFFDIKAGSGFYSGTWKEGFAGVYDFNFTSDFGFDLSFDFQTNYYYSGRKSGVMRLDDFTGVEHGAGYSWKFLNAGARVSRGSENPYSVFSLGTSLNLKTMFIRWLPKTNNNISVEGSRTGNFYKTWNID